MYIPTMRTCTLCDSKVSPSKQLCDECYKAYSQYKHEDWFIAVDSMQVKQDSIDKNERYELPFNSSVNSSGVQEEHIYRLKRNVGKPRIDWYIVNTVLDIYDSNRADVEEGLDTKMSLRDIALAINNKISFLSVRNILKTYRPDYNRE